MSLSKKKYGDCFVRFYVHLGGYLLKRTKMPYKDYAAVVNLYRACQNNAIGLLEDSRILLDKKRYSSAYFMAFTAKEEMHKGGIVADYANGYLTRNEFAKAFYDHNFKISYGGFRFALKDDGVVVKFNKLGQEMAHSLKHRTDSLYVSFGQNFVPQLPGEKINRKLVAKLIETIEDEFEEIIQNEYFTSRIGSDAYLK